MKIDWKLLVCVVVPLVIWALPLGTIPIHWTETVDGAEVARTLSITEHRLVAIFAFAVLAWVLEPIPIFATSVLIIVLQLFLIAGNPSSGAGVGPFAMHLDMVSADNPDGEHLVPYKDLLRTFADPVIMLFLGGFFIAAAATKFRLDVNLARVLLKPFGTKPAWVMLGMMGVTAVFSMFMSNTACTAMMLAVAGPVLAALPANDRGRIGMALCIPLAANVGGMGTPIGTPPNAVAVKELRKLEEAGVIDHAPSFAEWMLFGVPLVIVLLLVAWLVLLLLYKPKSDKVELTFSGTFLKTGKAWVVYITSALTILLWLIGKPLALPSYVVAMIPVGVFCATGVITAKDLKGLSWDVLWLIAGGFALGMAMQKTGLSAHLVASIPFDGMGAWPILIVAGAVSLIMATFMSNTATANLLVPLMAALGAGLADQLGSVGGAYGLVLGATFGASLGMALPISTPPNAMAHATGMIETKDMAKAGGITCVIGLMCGIITIVILNLAGFFG